MLMMIWQTFRFLNPQYPLPLIIHFLCNSVYLCLLTATFPMIPTCLCPNDTLFCLHSSDFLKFRINAISCWGAKFLANSSQNLPFSKNIIFISVHYSSLISKICSFQKCQLVSFLTFFLMNIALIWGTVMYRSLQWFELGGLWVKAV